VSAMAAASWRSTTAEPGEKRSDGGEEHSPCLIWHRGDRATGVGKVSLEMAAALAGVGYKVELWFAEDSRSLLSGGDCR
jgi:hypothetical protein